jgi:hypothetical protein
LRGARQPGNPVISILFLYFTIKVQTLNEINIRFNAISKIFCIIPLSALDNLPILKEIFLDYLLQFFLATTSLCLRQEKHGKKQGQ